MQQHGRDAHAARDQLSHHLGRERSGGAGHLGAARCGAEDGLVLGKVVPLVQVAVGDRASDPVEHVPQRLDAGMGGSPQSVARARGRRAGARVRVEQRQGGTFCAGERQLLALGGVEHGPRSIGGGTDLDDPGAVAQVHRHVHHDVGPVGESRVRLAGDRLGGVDDDEVAGFQVVGEVAEVRVPNAVAVSDEQLDLVAGDAPRLGRRGRRALPRRGEAGTGADVDDRHASCSICRPSPGTPATRVSSAAR